MMTSAFLVILSRWLHVTTAAVAVGGVFYVRIVLPVALRAVDDVAARAVLLRGRRVFKIVVHSCVLFLLLSGTYNAWLNWPAYTRLGPAVGHSLFGTHLLLGLAALGLLFWLVMAPEPPARHPTWMAVTFGLMLAGIAVASVLKYAREHAAAASMTTSAGVPGPAR